MSEQYTSLGLMSGTSGDGVDASIINLMVRLNTRLLKTNIMNMTVKFIKIFIDLKKKFTLYTILKL